MLDDFYGAPVRITRLEAYQILDFWGARCQGEIPSCIYYTHAPPEIQWYVHRGSTPLTLRLVDDLRCWLGRPRDTHPQRTIDNLLRAMDEIQATPTDHPSTDADVIIGTMAGIAQGAARDALRKIRECVVCGGSGVTHYLENGRSRPQPCHDCDGKGTL